tara:strand:- start:613 stop:1188 length:576 start_codon:yes stop_codon:yes gene_type:complete
MAFITDAENNVISFAEFTDVVQKDQRILDSNNLKIPAESGFTDTTEFIEDMLEKSTNRILLKLKASTWWQSYNGYVGNPISSLSALPVVNPNLIDPGNKQKRRQQFTDLCVYHCFSQFLLPLIADFGNPESEETSKITYYDAKFNDLFQELISIADWYDYDASGTVETDEKAISYAPTRRSRSRRTIAQVR